MRVVKVILIALLSVAACGHTETVCVECNCFLVVETRAGGQDFEYSDFARTEECYALPDEMESIHAEFSSRTCQDGQFDGDRITECDCACAITSHGSFSF